MKKALQIRGTDLPKGIIFHSDGGGQYYDQDFLALTKHNGFQNSMCEFAYENGKAERINGVIKNNYLRHWDIQDLGQLVKAVDRAVHLYNTDKPHISLQRQTPTTFETKHIKLAVAKPQGQPNRGWLINLQTVNPIQALTFQTMLNKWLKSGQPYLGIDTMLIANGQ